MGCVRARIGRAGTVRFQALYVDVKGMWKSAGTFATEKAATRAWQRAEEQVAEGRKGDPRRGRQRFRQYVLEDWLPHHEIEARTRETYTYYVERLLLPEFGPMKMVEILPIDVRRWITTLKSDGVSPSVIRYAMTVLSAIFTTALNDQMIHLHPCRGVKTPPVPKRPRTIITPEQFDAIYAALPSDPMRLLAELAIETGLRWGELTELRPKDIDFRTRMLTVSRVVVELVPKFHPSGERFLVKAYPKDKEYRRVKLGVDIAAKLRSHVDQGLDDDDLLFVMPDSPRPALKVVADPETLGWTEPNGTGRRYRHGTLSAYAAGKCRCRHCKDAYAQYRARRRAAGKDHPRNPRVVDSDGHIVRRWFRERVWIPALRAADVRIPVRTHDLRHAHASWLLAGGADLQVVKERLGHASIVTTEKYLHTLPDADESALDALAKVRRRGPCGRRLAAALLTQRQAQSMVLREVREVLTFSVARGVSSAIQHAATHMSFAGRGLPAAEPLPPAGPSCTRHLTEYGSTTTRPSQSANAVHFRKPQPCSFAQATNSPTVTNDTHQVRPASCGASGSPRPLMISDATSVSRTAAPTQARSA